jgi:HD superfamily phosphohydrolase
MKKENNDFIFDLEFDSSLSLDKKRYKPFEPKIEGQGGYGIVIKVKDYTTSNEKHVEHSIRALKILKPEHVKNTKVSEDFFEEIRALSKLNHQNVIRIYDWGHANQQLSTTQKNKKDIPYYVMEYIDNDLNKILSSENSISQLFFEELAIQLLTAIDTCHQSPEKIIHLDIKPDNILISKEDGNYRFVLTDFGKAKLVETDFKLIDKSYDTIGGGIFKYVHPTLRPYLRKNKVPIEDFKKYAELFDLFSIGTVLKDVYVKIDNFNNLPDEENPWFYFIEDLCYDPSDSHSTKRLHIINTSKDALLIAKRIVEKVDIYDKLISDCLKEKQIPLIKLSKRENIYFPERFSKYVDTIEFQRLRKIRQLGSTEFVYPSASNSRFGHSIGTFNKAYQYVLNLKKHPLFNYLFDYNDIEGLLLAALLHDIGHYPFAHFLEEIEGLESNLTIKHEVYTKAILSGKLKISNLLQLECIGSFLSKVELEIYKRKINEKQSISTILNNNKKIDLINKVLDGDGKYKILKSIVNGPIDCDKIDYLIRDSNSTGVSYGDNIDLERFYCALTIDTEKFPNVGLAITPKGKSAVETIISARYHMFSEVYWHKTCRSATSMIKDAFWYAYKNITQDELNCAVLFLNDYDFIKWLYSKIENDKIAYDLLGGIFISNDRFLYKRLRTYSSEWYEDSKLNSYEFFKSLGSNFKSIHEFKIRFIENLNKIGLTQQIDWIIIEDHHLIIDIPNIKQDRYPQIRVKYSSNIKGKRWYSMQEISSLSKSISNTFSTEVKKVRIFCHPMYFTQLNSLGNLIDKTIKDSEVKGGL